MKSPFVADVQRYAQTHSISQSRAKSVHEQKGVLWALGKISVGSVTQTGQVHLLWWEHGTVILFPVIATILALGSLLVAARLSSKVLPTALLPGPESSLGLSTAFPADSESSSCQVLKMLMELLSLTVVGRANAVVLA